MENEEALPTIVVPGPELREKVDGFAARLSGLDRRKADEMVAKLLASSKRNQFLFVDTSHIFYPYFLSKLTEFRQHPELRPQKAGEGKDGGDGAAGVATTTKAGNITRTTGGTAGTESDPQREELLRQTEAEARRYLEDPFPNRYSLDQRAGTVDVTALLMDVLSTTAQYAAKYGDKFLDAVKGKQRQNPLFHFLQEDDVRHGMFRKLVESYRRILNFDPEETETRLENLGSTSYLLDTVCAEKHKYAKSALARRRAALLTDDELRGRLQWTLFSVVQTFKLSDLQLDGPVPDTAASKQRPVVNTQYLSPALASAGGSGSGEASSAPAAGGRGSASGRSGGAASPSAGLSAPAAAPEAAPSRSATLRPPGAPPAGFEPVFMSSSLVKNTGSNGKRPRERGG